VCVSGVAPGMEERTIRSQTFLEQWKSECLAGEARRKVKTPSEVARGGLTERIESRSSGAAEHDPFIDIIGMVSSGDGNVAWKHDRCIYGIEPDSGGDE
jgi:hypothetical protein